MVLVLVVLVVLVLVVLVMFGGGIRVGVGTVIEAYGATGQTKV